MTHAQKTSRRKFVAQCSAAVSLPYFISSQALAGPDRPGANDRVGVGYIGLGRRSAQLMGLPKSAQIVAVSDVYLSRAEGVAKRVKAALYEDYRKLLEDSQVDAVVVATPDHWHALASIHACQAGKDVYCEKPLSLTIREGRQMVDAARKYKRVFQTGSQQRSMAINRAACEFIRGGGLGTLEKVVGHNYPSPWKCAFPAETPPAGLDWNRWNGPSPSHPYHAELFIPRGKPGWISFRDFSGGEMTGWGAHGLDQIQWALGMDNSGPVEVWTEGEAMEAPTYTTPEPRGRGEKLCAHPKVFFRYANGVTVELANGPAGGGLFIGSKGQISIDRDRVSTTPAELRSEVLASGSQAGPNAHLQNWIDCIRSRERPVADVEIGHRTATVCHLGNIARWLNRKLRWDPERECFPDDEEANKLVAREQRAGFEIPDPV